MVTELQIPLPNAIFVCDDAKERSASLIEALRDLSWLNKESIDKPWEVGDLKLLEDQDPGWGARLPKELQELAYSNPTCLSDKIQFLDLSNAVNVPAVIDRLRTSGDAIAFVDFWVDDIDACRAFLEYYNSGTQSKCWQLNLLTEEGKRLVAGLVLGDAFLPDGDPPSQSSRVFVPTTRHAINELHSLYNKFTSVRYNRPLRGPYMEAFLAALEGLQGWFDVAMDKSPLVLLWEHTERYRWFSSNPDQSAGFSPCHEFSNIVEAHYADYRQAIADAMGVDIPHEWCRDYASLYVIHESLKAMCGVSYCGIGGGENKYNLRVGSVFLIALMAMSMTQSSNRESDVKLIRNALGPNPTNIRDAILKVFPPQNKHREIAKNGAEALYCLLLNLFSREPSGYGGLESVEFQENGAVLKFIFDVSANVAWKTGKDSLSTQIADRLHEQVILDEAEMASSEDSNEWKEHLVPCILRLYRFMNQNDKGYGAPGCIIHEGNTLIIAGG
jgi:hypothetical protein